MVFELLFWGRAAARDAPSNAPTAAQVPPSIVAAPTGGRAQAVLFL